MFFSFFQIDWKFRVAFISPSSVLLSLLFPHFTHSTSIQCVCISSSADKIAHFQAGDIGRALEMSFFLSQMMSTTVRLSPKEMEDIQGRKKCIFRFSDQLETSLRVCRDSRSWRWFLGMFKTIPWSSHIHTILCDFMKTNETENWWRRSYRELACKRSSDITHRQSPLWALRSLWWNSLKLFRTVKNQQPIHNTDRATYLIAAKIIMASSQFSR